jgi:hypothetical protein
MADADDLDDEVLVEDLVHHPVAADTDAIRTILTGEGNASGRPRISGQQVDGGSDSLLLLARETRKDLDSASSDLNSVGAQRSPSSALTSSQGT